MIEAGPRAGRHFGFRQRGKGKVLGGLSGIGRCPPGAEFCFWKMPPRHPSDGLRKGESSDSTVQSSHLTAGACGAGEACDRGGGIRGSCRQGEGLWEYMISWKGLNNGAEARKNKSVTSPVTSFVLQ